MKKVKLITIILAIVLITMVAFFGVYVQVQNRMENNVKNYSLAMDLEGARNIKLKVSTDSETIVKDSEGNEVEDADELTDEEIAENGYTKEETPVNDDDVLNLENYKKAKEVIEKRLKGLQVTSYEIKLDGETGDMVIQLPENDNTDSIVSNIETTGKFEIIDTETEEVLMNNSDIKTAKVMYGNSSQTTTSSGTSVYLDIEFNKEGSKKLEEISNKYVKVEKTDEENEDETTEETEKTITMKIDDTEVMSTSFDASITTGKLQLSVGSATTDTDTVKENAAKASTMATVLDSGNIPVKYELEGNEYILSDISDNGLEIAIYVILAVTVIALITLMIRYKSLGCLGVMSYIGFISLFILLIRYTNVVISMGGIFGFAIALILNYAFINKILKKLKLNTDLKDEEKIKEITKELYKDFFIKIIPVCIATIVFSFTEWVAISSLGMVMFWGIVLIAVYNSIVTNNLVKIELKK